MHPRATVRRAARVAVAVAGLAALAATLPAEAEPNGVTVMVPGLGRATELDLLSRGPNGLFVVEKGDALANSTAVGYGIGAAAPQTTDVTPRGLLTRAWSNRNMPGSTALLNTATGLVIAGEPNQSGTGSTIGAVYPRTPNPRMSVVQSAARSTDPTVVESNLNAGAAVWTWTYRGMQYVNDYGNGRQIQTSLFVRRPGSTALYNYNPTEAGDEWANQMLNPDLRHGSPVAQATTRGTTQTTRAIPLEWSPLRLSPSGEAWTPVLYQDVRLGKDLTLDIDGMSGVARYRTVMTVPESLEGSLEMPSVYLRGNFSTYYGVDAVAGTSTQLFPEAYDPLVRQRTDGIDWVPSSGRGGVVAATLDGQHAMGIYGRTTAAGGPVTTFNVHNFIPNALWQLVPGYGNGQYDWSTAKLRAMHTGTFSRGTSSFESFIVTGTLSEVVAKMHALTQRH